MPQDRNLYARRVHVADAQDHLATAIDRLEMAQSLSPDADHRGYQHAIDGAKNLQHILDGLMEGLKR